ncbi:hypothetical protein TrLO_g2824 [Triparma laevis f. longispina]|uniref:Uncharacterized protein n=1 Tax=Triparma laevis f. longispina TaxID=1714387 RepID=A0A9W7FSI4_9STRA|nr:hypothetical protein TrLO_g2824 [Triparma laevis f. longispina]
MSNSVASESKVGHETPKTSRKRGGKDEEDEDGEGIIEGSAAANSTTLVVVDIPEGIDRIGEHAFAN